jgi:RimJ/RimL family protein N-acetyltransferase
VLGVLEGRNVNLRIMEKEDLSLFVEWWNSSEFMGGYVPFPEQLSKANAEKLLATFGFNVFFVQKKDGEKIGNVTFYNSYIGGNRLLEIGYVIIPSERGKGYCTEATQLMVDYLFLSMDISRIMASPSIKNTGSQRVLEKAGFTKEGTIRNSARGARRDSYLYSILREEWKEPKILTKTA